MTKLKVVKPAVKEKSGKVISDTVAYSHSEIEKKAGRKKNQDKRGFLLSNGEFANRKEAAKVAKAAGEVKHPGKKLHSHELREGLEIKKAKEPK
jgi:phage protein D